MTPETNPPGRDTFLVLVVSFGLIGLLLFLGWRGVTTLRSQTLLPEATELREAEIALRQGNVGKARMVYDGAIAKQRGSVQIYALVSASCEMSAQLPLAIEYAKQGLTVCKSASREEKSMLNRLLAEVYSEAEPTHPQTRAIQYAEEAYRLAPEDPQSLNMLGYILADNDQQLEHAKALVGQALVSIKDQADNPRGMFTLTELEDSYGWVLYKMHRYPDAVAALVQATGDASQVQSSGRDNLQTGPISGDILKILYYHLGTAQRMAGHKDAAALALATALRYDPNYGPAIQEKAALAAGDQTNPAPALLPTVAPAPPAVTVRSNAVFTPLPLPPNASLKRP